MTPFLLGLGGVAPEPTTLEYKVSTANDAESIVRGVTYRGSAGGEDPLYWHSRKGASLNTNLRFTGVAVPQGATIVDARLTVYANAAASGMDANDFVVVGAEQVDSATAVTDYSTHNTRAASVGVTVNWPVPNIALLGADTSPNLASVVQQIVNRALWSAGNIQFFIESNFNSVSKPDIERHNFVTAPSSAYYPTLSVTYTA